MNFTASFSGTLYIPVNVELFFSSQNQLSFWFDEIWSTLFTHSSRRNINCQVMDVNGTPHSASIRSLSCPIVSLQRLWRWNLHWYTFFYSRFESLLPKPSSNNSVHL